MNDKTFGVLKANCRHVFLVGTALTLLTACGGSDAPEVTPEQPTYNLSGTATGLSGTVELSANSETISIAGDGAFSFTTEWDDNTTITLAVESAPSTQSCEISPAQVTINGADVTNLQLVCEDLTYTISGTAEGLSGDAMITANDETITVSQNGEFAFATEWVSGTTVQLSVGSAPTGQQCELTPQSVTLVDQDITDVSLVCGDTQSVSYSMQCTASGNSRPLTLNYTINGSAYSQLVDEPEIELEQPVISGDEVRLSIEELVGHQCTVSPAEFVVGDSVPTIIIDCVTFGDVSVFVSDYRTATAIENARVQAYIYDASTGTGIEDESAYVQLDEVVTDAEGRAHVEGVGYQERLVVRSSADGYATRSDVVRTSVENAEASTSIGMIAVDATFDFDATTAQSLTVENSALAVDLPANAFVDSNGDAVTGTVTASLTNIDASSDPDIMPGDFEAYDPGTDQVQLIESFGAMSAEFVDAAGNEVNLADNTSATVRIPLAERSSNPPTTIPLIHFNEVTGIWEVEGEASLLTDATSGKRYYEGTVGHFSTWNADVLFDSVTVHGCVLREDGETPRAGIRVRAEGVDYIGRSSAYTNSEGDYSIKVRPNSEVLISVDDASGLSTTFSLDVGSSDYTLPECSVAVAGSMRVTLTWGANPDDLDSHLTGPAVPNGQTAGERFRVYYANKQETINDVTIDLDVDDTTSYGPEVITVPAFPHPGVYRYAVHQYSGSSTVYSSPTRVELQLNGETYVFAPSVDGNTDGINDMWVVFDLTVAENGDVSLTRVDEYMPRDESDVPVNGQHVGHTFERVEKTTSTQN